MATPQVLINDTAVKAVAGQQTVVQLNAQDQVSIAKDVLAKAVKDGKNLKVILEDGAELVLENYTDLPLAQIDVMESVSIADAVELNDVTGLSAGEAAVAGSAGAATTGAGAGAAAGVSTTALVVGGAAAVAVAVAASNSSSGSGSDTPVTPPPLHQLI